MKYEEPSMLIVILEMTEIITESGGGGLVDEDEDSIIPLNENTDVDF